MTSSTSPSKLDVAVLITALVGPSVVVAGVLGWMSVPGDEVAHPDAVAFHEALDAVDPDVVVLGNSVSFRAVDEQQLGDALGRPGKVAKIFVPDSRSSAWYALTSSVVLARPRLPSLVVVAAPRYQLLATDHDARDLERLRNLLGADAESVLSRITGQPASDARLLRLQDAVDHLFSWARDAAVGVAFGSDEGLGWIEGGRATADAAAAVVLDIERIVADPTSGAHLPVTAPTATAVTLDPGPEVAAGFLQDLAREASDAGVRVVFVAIPVPSRGDLDEEVLAQTLKEVGALGAGWIDLSTLDMPASGYFDGVHMTGTGRERFTAALAEGLSSIHALEGELVTAEPRRTWKAVQRVGSPPAPGPLAQAREGSQPCEVRLGAAALAEWSPAALLKSTGFASFPWLKVHQDGVPLKASEGRLQGCDGTFVWLGSGFVARTAKPWQASTFTLAWRDALPDRLRIGRAEVDGWWVLPETSLQFGFEDLATPSTIEVTAWPIGTPSAWARWGSGERVELTVSGDVLAARLPITGSAMGPLELGATGGGLLLRSVQLEADGREQIIFQMPSGRSDAVPLLTGPPGAVRVVAQTPPPAITAGAAVEQKGAPLLARVPLVGLSDFDPKVLDERASAAKCLPVRATLNGAPLPGGNAGLRAVHEQGKGAYHTVRGQIVVTAPDGEPALRDDRVWGAFLEPERACAGRLWVYPGDVLEVTTRLAASRADGLVTVELAGAVLVSEPGDKMLEVEVWAGDARLGGGSLPLADFEGRANLVALDAPVDGAVNELRLRLRTPTDGPYVLLTTAVLRK